MKEKPSERLLQVTLGILLILISGLYLWRDTVLPILNSKPSLASASDAVRLGARYGAWKDRVEEARARALEADWERQRAVEAAGQGDVKKSGASKNTE